jgi:hypothetical protein
MPTVLVHTMMPWQLEGGNKWEVGVHHLVGVVRLQNVHILYHLQVQLPVPSSKLVNT